MKIPILNRKFRKRRQQLLKAIGENPKDLERYVLLAKFYYVNRCYPESIEVYKKLLQYHPKDISVLYNLAVACQANKELEKAKELYLHILKLKPQHKDAQQGLEKLTTFK